MFRKRSSDWYYVNINVFMKLFIAGYSMRYKKVYKLNVKNNFKSLF